MIIDKTFYLFNWLSPSDAYIRHQTRSSLSHAIISGNAGLLTFGPLPVYFNDIWINIKHYALKKMHLKMQST